MPETPSQPIRILIIDDHASFRSVARELLERRGFAVVGEAGCATSGLETVERVKPEAVLLDVHLPDGDGVDLCHALTRRNPRLAVLLVSADELNHRAGQIRDSGARGLLAKSRLGSSNLAALLTG